MDLEHLTGFRVADAGTDHPGRRHGIRLCVHQPGDGRGGQDRGTQAGGGTGHGDCVAGVVDLGVVVPEGAGEPVGGQAGGQAAHRGHREGPWPGQVPTVRVHAGQQVVQRDPGSQVGALDDAAGQREQERQGAHQVGCQVTQQEATLDQRLVDQGELPLLQVAQAAVGQP